MYLRNTQCTHNRIPIYMKCAWSKNGIFLILSAELSPTPKEAIGFYNDVYFFLYTNFRLERIHNIYIQIKLKQFFKNIGLLFI